MTAPAQKIFVSGMNAARIFGLTSNGYLDGTGVAAYSGKPVGGPISLEVTSGDPTTIVHPGNNSKLQQDSFPSSDPTTGLLKVSRLDLDTLAFLKNIKVHTVGDINMIGWNTSQAGNEPTVALVAYQQGKLTNGDRGWHTYVMGRTVIRAKPSSMLNRDRADIEYAVDIQNATALITGVPFTIADDGYTFTDLASLESNYRLAFGGFKSVTNDTIFTLDALLPARASGIIKVSVNGGPYLVEGAGAGKVVSTTTGFTLGTASTTGDYIGVMYEIANDSDDLS